MYVFVNNVNPDFNSNGKIILAMSDGGIPSNQGSKLQSAIYYAIDGDQINIMNMLAQKMEEPWVSYIKIDNKIIV